MSKNIRALGGRGINYTEEPPSEYYCNICDAQMNSDDMWESHVTGKRHIKNLEKENQMGGSMTSSVGSSPRRLYGTVQSSALMVVDDVDNPDRSKSDYYCKVCDSHMNSDQMWESHISGKRHLKNVSKGPNERISKLKAYTLDTIPQIEEELDDYDEPFVGLECMQELRRAQRHLVPSYCCFLCNAYLQKSLLIEHIRSIKHKMAFLREKYPEKYNVLKNLDLKKEGIQSLVEDAALEHEENFGRGRMEVKIERQKQSVFPIQNYARLLDPRLEARYNRSLQNYGRPAIQVKNSESKLAIEAPKREKKVSTSKTTTSKQQIPVVKSPPEKKKPAPSETPVKKKPTSDSKWVAAGVLQSVKPDTHQRNIASDDKPSTSSEVPPDDSQKAVLPDKKLPVEVVPTSVVHTVVQDIPVTKHYEQYVPPSVNPMMTMPPTNMPYNYSAMYMTQGPMVHLGIPRIPSFCMFPSPIVIGPQVPMQVMAPPPPPPPGLYSITDYHFAPSTNRQQSCVIQELDDDDVQICDEVNRASSSMEKKQNSFKGSELGQKSDVKDKSSNLTSSVSTPKEKTTENKVEISVVSAKPNNEIQESKINVASLLPSAKQDFSKQSPSVELKQVDKIQELKPDATGLSSDKQDLNKLPKSVEEMKVTVSEGNSNNKSTEQPTTEEKDKKFASEPTPVLEEKIFCSTCHLLGHVNTEKNCPLYREPVPGPTSSSELPKEATSNGSHILNPQASVHNEDVLCSKCHEWGHMGTDIVCPLVDKAPAPCVKKASDTEPSVECEDTAKEVTNPETVNKDDSTIVTNEQVHVNGTETEPVEEKAPVVEEIAPLVSTQENKLPPAEMPNVNNNTVVEMETAHSEDGTIPKESEKKKEVICAPTSVLHVTTPPVELEAESVPNINPSAVIEKQPVLYFPKGKKPQKKSVEPQKLSNAQNSNKKETNLTGNKIPVIIKRNFDNDGKLLKVPTTCAAKDVPVTPFEKMKQLKKNVLKQQRIEEKSLPPAVQVSAVNGQPPRQSTRKKPERPKGYIQAFKKELAEKKILKEKEVIKAQTSFEQKIPEPSLGINTNGKDASTVPKPSPIPEPAKVKSKDIFEMSVPTVIREKNVANKAPITPTPYSHEFAPRDHTTSNVPQKPLADFNLEKYSQSIFSSVSQNRKTKIAYDTIKEKQQTRKKSMPESDDEDEAETLEIRPIQPVVGVHELRKQILEKRIKAKAEALKSQCADDQESLSSGLTVEEILKKRIQKTIEEYQPSATVSRGILLKESSEPPQKKLQAADKHVSKKVPPSEGFVVPQDQLEIVEEIFSRALRSGRPSVRKKLMEYQCSACQQLGIKHTEEDCPLFKSLRVRSVATFKQKIADVVDNSPSDANSTSVRCVKCFQLGHVYPDKRCILYKQHLSGLDAGSVISHPSEENRTELMASAKPPESAKVVCSECLDEGHTKNDPQCIYYTGPATSGTEEGSSFSESSQHLKQSAERTEKMVNSSTCSDCFSSGHASSANPLCLYYERPLELRTPAPRDPVSFADIIQMSERQELGNFQQNALVKRCTVCGLTGHTDQDPVCLYFEKPAEVTSASPVVMTSSSVSNSQPVMEMETKPVTPPVMMYDPRLQLQEPRDDDGGSQSLSIPFVTSPPFTAAESNTVMQQQCVPYTGGGANDMPMALPQMNVLYYRSPASFISMASSQIPAAAPYGATMVSGFSGAPYENFPSLSPVNLPPQLNMEEKTPSTEYVEMVAEQVLKKLMAMKNPKASRKNSESAKRAAESSSSDSSEESKTKKKKKKHKSNKSRD